MNIRDILLILVIIYVFYLHCKINKKKNIEKFAVTDDIKAAVKEIYNTDMEAIRQLSDMATKLNAGGLEIPGNLIVKGNITNTGSITSSGAINSSSDIISKTDIKIVKDSVTPVLLSSVKTNTDSNTTSISSINTNLPETLKSYIKYSDNIRITNRGTGVAIEYGEPYIGVCGSAGSCTNKIDVTMVTNADVSTFKIIRG